MRIDKLAILISFILSAVTASAMKYQIKVLNTPFITIDGKEFKVGDWFDDQSVITWSKENQAMRVVSENNKVYTLSAKLYKESKSKKFADFILYTKPLAARGANDDSLIAQLQERFDNDFFMLDELVIDLSDFNLPEGCFFQLIKKAKEGTRSIIFDVIPKDKVFYLNRSCLEFEDSSKEETMTFIVSYKLSPTQFETVTESFEITLLSEVIN